MVEIIIHGRGGQGSVTMAELLAEAAFFDGRSAQAFPNFGVERRGAPVAAYVRIADQEIRLRSHVYNPDFAIIQDATLLKDGKIMADLKGNAKALVNAGLSPEPALAGDDRVKLIDAEKIAREVIGKPIINTVLLGAFSAMTGLVTMEGIEAAIGRRFSGSSAEKNLLAARRGFDAVSVN